MKHFLVLTMVTLTAASLFGQSVVASTSWTGAFAQLAGADEVRVLAPYDMTHPPEYELRPSDLRSVAQADYVVYAGYETMVERLLATADDSEAEAIQIVTVHSEPVLRRSVSTIASALGTETVAEQRLEELLSVLDRWRADVREYGLDEERVIVHFHQRALAEDLGMNVVGVFGPAPLEARQIDELSKLEPALIIDNGHNPIATPLLETTEARTTTWYNFPGIQDTRTLFDIFALNRADLTSVMAPAN